MWLQQVLANPQLGWPTLEDLNTGAVYFDEDLRIKVDHLLESRRVVNLAAPEGHGKTSFARTYAHRLNTVVWHVDLSRASDEVLETCHRLRNVPATFLIENIQGNPRALAQLFDAFAEADDAKLICTERRLSNQESVIEEGLFLGQSVPQVDVVPSLATYQAIVEHHRANCLPRPCQPLDTHWNRIIERQTARNLRVLRSYLDVWQSGHLIDVPNDKPLERIFATRFAPFTPGERLTLVQISAITQFGIDAEGGTFDLAAVEKLSARGLVAVTSKRLTPYVSLAHRTDGLLNLRAYATQSGERWQELSFAAIDRYVNGASEEAVDNLLEQLRRVVPAKFREIAARPSVRQRTISRLIALIPDSPFGFAEACLNHQLPDRASKIALVRAFFALPDEQLLEKYSGANIVQLSRFSRALRDLNLRRELARHKRLSKQLTSEQWSAIWLRSPMARLVKFLWRYAEAPDVHEHTDQAGRVLHKLAAEPDFAERLNDLDLEHVGKLARIAGKLGEPAATAVGVAIVDNLVLSASDPPARVGLVVEALRRSGVVEPSDRLLSRALRVLPIAAILDDLSGEGLSFLLGNAEYSEDEECQREGRELWTAVIKNPRLEQAIQGWNPKSFARTLWAGFRLEPVVTRRWIQTIDISALDRLIRTAQGWSTFLLLWNIWQANPRVCEAIIQRHDQFLKTRVSERGDGNLILCSFMAWHGVDDVRHLLPLHLLDLSAELRIPSRLASFFALHAADLTSPEEGRLAAGMIRQRLVANGSDVRVSLSRTRKTDSADIDRLFFKYGLIEPTATLTESSDA